MTNVQEDEGEVVAALRKFKTLRDRANELHQVNRQLMQEVQDLRREVENLTRDLSDRRNLRGRHNVVRRDRAAEARVEAQVEAKRAELKRKQDRQAEVGARHQELRRLVDRCHEFLTANGASIEELQTGVALPQKQRGAV